MNICRHISLIHRDQASLSSPIPFPFLPQDHVLPTMGTLPDGQGDLHVLLLFLWDLLSCAQIGGQRFI